MTKAAEKKIAKVNRRLTELSPRLNQYKLKTKEQIKEAIKKAAKGASGLFQIQLIEDKQIVQRQIGPGKPGPNTQYKEEENIFTPKGRSLGYVALRFTFRKHGRRLLSP